MSYRLRVALTTEYPLHTCNRGERGIRKEGVLNSISRQKLQIQAFHEEP